MFSTLISAHSLHTHLADVRVVDCRFSLTDLEHGHNAYRAGHIPGAVYAHLDNDLSSPVTSDSGRHPLPNFDQFLEKLKSWGIDHRTQLVAYDDAGGFYAARFWWLMKVLGHDAVAVLDGGIQCWRKAGFGLSSTSPSYPPSRYLASPDHMLWMDTETVTQLDQNENKLIDARTPERFSGESEPIDTVAGHIPGALNQPVPLNLADTGIFQPKSVLREHYTRHCGTLSPEHIVHYCGSGVFACHGILAMAHAGMGMSRLYPGSWSEWIRDPNRPVAP